VQEAAKNDSAMKLQRTALNKKFIIEIPVSGTRDQSPGASAVPHTGGPAPTAMSHAAGFAYHRHGQRGTRVWKIKFKVAERPASAFHRRMKALPYTRLTLAEIQRLRGLNAIQTRDLIQRSQQSIQASWAIIARAQRVLDGNDPLRDQNVADQVAAEVVDLTRRSVRLRDDGSFLATIGGRRSA
jgi:hypothetical protein